MNTTNRFNSIALLVLGAGLSCGLAGCDSWSSQQADDTDRVILNSNRRDTIKDSTRDTGLEYPAGGGRFRGTSDRTTIGGGLSGNAGNGGSAPTGGADTPVAPIPPR